MVQCGESLRLIHEEDEEKWEEHEHPKHAGGSGIDQFSACPLRDARRYHKAKKGVAGLGRPGYRRKRLRIVPVFVS